MANFQLRLFRHYNNNGAPLYNPSQMEAFAPVLFMQILNAISNSNSALSKERKETQRKRTVALLHILAYFRYK